MFRATGRFQNDFDIRVAGLIDRVLASEQEFVVSIPGSKCMLKVFK